ncbi:MAG: FecR domain-containing protein [Burkholderiales bacterium]|nr:FecR domain-containing protein [Burkholderiales bacterium]
MHIARRIAHRILLAGAVFASAASLAQAPAQEAGTVERVSGTVSVSAAGVARVARPGERLLVGEILTTEPGAEALVRLRDQSTMALRANTQVVVAEMRFEEKSDDSMVASLLKGTIRAVTGLLGRTRPQGVLFRTPTATVGIRGTDLEIAIIPGGERDRAGVYNYVHEGVTNIQIGSGENLDVAAEQTGFAPDNPQPGEPALQLLRERPAFLRGGGFDAMMLQVRPPPAQQIFMPRMR